jgi:hypothetical protein
MVVLDTNGLSALMRDPPDRAVVAWLDGQPPESVWTTSITVAASGADGAPLTRGDEPTVSADDLINLDTSTESKWVASVYLLEWIRDRSTNAKSIWARRLADPALGYQNTKALLDDLKSRIASSRLDGARALDGDGRIGTAVDQLHFQAAQLAVCLVFASTFSDSEAEREFRSIGVNVGEAIRTDLNVPVLLGSGTILGVLIDIALTFLGVMLDDVRADDPSGLLWRTRAIRHRRAGLRRLALDQPGLFEAVLLAARPAAPGDRPLSRRADRLWADRRQAR